MKRLFFVLVGSLFMLQPLYAQRKPYVDWKNQDMDSLLMWFKDGVPTDFSKLRDLEFKRSHVRPRAVIMDRATQLDTSIDPRRSVFANLPIGGNDLLTGLPSGNFDEDVFSAWPYVKIHGNWSNPWFTAPAAYTDAAHKHGTAVLSAWFFAWDWAYAAGKTKEQDANAYKIELMTKKDAQGKFIYAEPMVNIMQYFGMDGINYNSECFFGDASGDMKAFHNELYKLAKKKNFDTFHVGWYNSVSNDGTKHGGRWLLDYTNYQWYYHDGEFVADAFMLDYSWGADQLSTTVKTAKQIAAPNGALDVYAGMWLVKFYSSYFSALNQHKEVSIGLWGEHKLNRFFQHRSGLDLKSVQGSYQDRLEWFFSGKTQNPKDAKANDLYSAAGGVDDDAYLKKFHGIAKHVAERSTVQGSLPFATGFNLGNGLSYYDRGVKTLGSWYNLSAQDMTPTYRWLITDASGAAAANVKARFSHDDAWIGGSSLLLEGTAKASPTDITLYRTKLSTKKDSAYSTKPVKPMDFTVESVNECASLVDLKMVWSMSADNKKRLVYNDEVNVDHFEVWIKEPDKDPKMVAHTSSWAHYLPKYEWENNLSTTFDVGVRAVAQDLVTTSEMAWRTVTRNAAAAAVTCVGGKGDYCEAVNDLGQAADAHLKRYFDSAYTVGADANIKVHGQPPATPGLEGYAFFRNDTIKVTPGKTFTFKAEAIRQAPGQTSDFHSMQWNKYRVYVDWDGDGEFDADREMIRSGGKENAGDINVCHLNFSVNVPDSAAPGVTRMRIRYADAWVAHPGACGLAAGGYTADFCILVAGAEGATETPEAPGAASVRPDFDGATLNTPYPNAYLVYKLDGGAAGDTSNLYLLLKKKGAAEPTAYPLNAATAAGWNEANIPLRDLRPSDTIVSVGLRVKSAAGDKPLKAYIGELKLLPGTYEPQKVKVSKTADIENFAITSSISVKGTDTLVAYGSPLKLTFGVATAGKVATVTVNNVPTACTYDAATSKYTVSIASVVENLRVSVAAGSPCTVKLEKPAAVEIVSASAPEMAQRQYGLASGSAFTLTFKVGNGYEVPKVMIGSTPYQLGAAGAGGVYAVTTGAITTDTSITITTSLKRLAVSVAAGSHVTLQTSASDTVLWGDSCEVRFTLAAGYNPVVTVGGAALPAPVAGSSGVYTVTLRNITAAVSVSLSAVIRQLDVTLSRDNNVVLQLGTSVGAKKVSYGGSYPFAFKVAEGYLPVLKVNGVEVSISAPDSTGLYRDTLRNITATTTISITSTLKPGNGNGNGEGNGQNPTGVSSVAADMPRFFPNPVNDMLTFVNTDRVSIHTVSGTLIGVYTRSTVSVAHLPAGVYMVKMQRGSTTKTAKLIKR
ncbi:MAG: GEVED domain-containing protein [Prevotellaceae bacterium]|jgi:endo-beta-N-acetylglucosaminidase D|nr:GEVED domain-containing protein [Prevotellaceae bacterium]